jgi:hypothetical protein
MKPAAVFPFFVTCLQWKGCGDHNPFLQVVLALSHPSVTALDHSSCRGWLVTAFGCFVVSILREGGWHHGSLARWWMLMECLVFWSSVTGARGLK